MGWVTSTLKSNVLALTAAFLVLVFGSVVHAQFDFVQRADFSTDARVDMVLHDVDGDGDVDLITADSILNQVGIQLGNGDGTFAAPATVTIAAGTRALAVGDINGDTFSDILVTRPGTLAGGNGIISVLLNQGNGTFLAPVDHLVIVPGIVNEQVTPVSLTIADLDGVGNLDVAIGTVLLNNLNQPGYFSIVINTGNDGANQPIFANSVNIDTLDSNTRAIVSGDFDNDSDIDLAVASAAGSSVNSVSVLLNDGSGTSGVVNRFRLSGTTTTVGRLIVGDINADTFLDLITINQSHSYSVLLNDGGTDITKAGEYSDQGQFPLGSQAGPALDIPTDGGLGDFDGDGDLDLVSGLVGSSGGTGSLVILPNDGTGLFGTEVPFAIGRDHTFLGVADIDGDADPDVLSVDVFQATATVLLNRLFPVVDVALRAVINPTLTQEGALPVGLTQVCPGSGFIVEVWVSQVNGGTARNRGWFCGFTF